MDHSGDEGNWVQPDMPFFKIKTIECVLNRQSANVDRKPLGGVHVTCFYSEKEDEEKSQNMLVNVCEHGKKLNLTCTIIYLETCVVGLSCVKSWLPFPGRNLVRNICVRQVLYA